MKKITALCLGLSATACGLLFTQCQNQSHGESVPPAGTTQSIKIAYVEVDSLLTSYTYWNDLNEAMISKEENIRATINDKAKKLDQAMQLFQHKLKNNAFLTRERAEQENNRLLKQQKDLQQLQQRLQADLIKEQQDNNRQLRDSINAFIEEYNKKAGFDFIFTNTGYDNMLYANKAYNITGEIIKGLNDRYMGGSKK
ncbi:MAG TPA: OmpH family outer membrane protein [Bacteroidaceae bacterium]|nr:OmpH family outer membrane protein [Bacteroidaceae bacterium]